MWRSCSISGVRARVGDRSHARVPARSVSQPMHDAPCPTRRAPPTRRRPRTGPSRRPRWSCGLRHQLRAGASSGRSGCERLALDAQQLLDRQLGLRVGALAVVVLEQARPAVEQVARRPALVLVVVPHLELGVEQHGVVDPQARDGRPDRVLARARARKPGECTPITRSPSSA